MHAANELLANRIAEQAAHLDAATHHLLADIRAFDTSAGWYEQGAKSCAHWLTWRIGWTDSTAREHVRVARKLGELPLLDDALRRGAVSYAKVRAITRVATPANEALLLEFALHTTGAQLEQICRRYRTTQAATDPRVIAERRQVTRRVCDDGMVEIRARPSVPTTARTASSRSPAASDRRSRSW